MDIASRLDAAMKAAGFKSQSALARAADVPQPTINRILKNVGKKGPEAHTLQKLAATCNVTFMWLHEGIEPRSRTGQDKSDAEVVAPPAATPPGVQWVSDEEYRLLTLFRCTDAGGRTKIMRTAEGMPKTLLHGVTDHKP